MSAVSMDRGVPATTESPESGSPAGPLWPPGTATGVGSLPGNDPREAARLVFDELPDLPHLPELPGRGAGADLVGRGALFLPDLPVDLQPAGWRLVSRPGGDLRRTRDMMARDLDALEEVADGYAGPLKLAVAGPWTLLASLELPRGHKALSDPGAVRDVTDALAEGVAAHVADVMRRVPGARPLLQLDEPSLPWVLAGRVPTPSGFGVLRAVEEATAADGLARVLAAAGVLAGVHCCAASPPLEVIRRAGAVFAGLDATLLTRADDDAVGEAVDAGLGLMLGVVPALDGELSSARRTVEPVTSLWNRLGFAPGRLGEVVAVTPTCGLAGASGSFARLAMRQAREAARVLVESPE
jgi:methionine synthase II (cobalamin-independent)